MGNSERRGEGGRKAREKRREMGIGVGKRVGKIRNVVAEEKAYRRGGTVKRERGRGRVMGKACIKEETKEGRYHKWRGTGREIGKLGIQGVREGGGNRERTRVRNKYRIGEKLRKQTDKVHPRPFTSVARLKLGKVDSERLDCRTLRNRETCARNKQQVSTLAK